MFDKEKLRNAVVSIIEAIGDNPSREGLKDTPERVASMYLDLFSGIDDDPSAALSTGFEESYDGLVIASGISFFSICEHHFLPFSGTAHIGYLPRGWVVGASKLARVVDTIARRPQLQERLTSQIADTIDTTLHPHGVMVLVKAEHLCMSMRGVAKNGSSIITTSARGLFRDQEAARREFLSVIAGG